MFKTITAFRIVDDETRRLLSLLHGVITEPTVIDPANNQWSAAGYSRPACFGNSTVFQGDGRTQVFNIQVRERVLPGKCIRKRVDEVAAEDAVRQGYTPGRKQRAEIRDRVLDELLPHAPIKPVDVLCMVTGEYLIIGTSSARLIDVVLDLLIGSFEQGPLRFARFNADMDLHHFFNDLLLDDSTKSGEFKCGDAVLLKGEKKSTARFKDMDVQAGDIASRIIAGMRPVELALEYNERIYFTMTEAGVLKRIKFTDLILDEVRESASEDEVDQFDGTVALCSREFRNLLDSLHDECKKPVAADEDDEL